MSMLSTIARAFLGEPLEERQLSEFPSFDDQLAAIRRQQEKTRPWRVAGVQEALGVPAILSAVSLISNTVGTLSLEAFKSGELMPEGPRIINRPNPFTTPRVFFRDTAFYLATRGEAWWWIAARDVDGLPMSLYPVPPWEITVAQNDRNRLFPKITWLDKPIPNDDIRHITYLPDHSGLRGLGPLQLAGAAVSVTVEADNWAANYFSGSIPSIVLTTDQDLNDEEIASLAAQWSEKPNNLPRFMTNGMKLEDSPFDAQKAQLSEARQHQVGEVARMYSMPGALIEYQMAGSSLTYQNQSDIWNDFARRCLSPHYLEPIEQEMSDLLTRSTVARFNTNQLLRADIKTRYDVYKVGIDEGIFGPEYPQRMEGLTSGGVDFAPVPLAPPQAVPERLPFQARSLSAGWRCSSCNRKIAEEQGYGTSIRCRCGTVNVGETMQLREDPIGAALTALATREQPVPQVNVHPAPVSVTIERGAIHVDAADMSSMRGLTEAVAELATREQPAPQVTVNPPHIDAGAVRVEVAPPNVEVHPTPVTVQPANVTVNVPEQRPTRKSIKRDKEGNITEINEEPT
jgi:HK97 family phage portal protein